MFIEPLRHERLKDANLLRNKIFTYLSKAEKQTLEASLDPQEYFSVFQALDLKSINYWVAIHDDQVAGMVGLYEEKEDALDSYWLGWYCVDETYRGQYMGKKLMAFAIEQAKVKAKRYLKLYTTSHDVYAVARSQYEKIGFSCVLQKGKTLQYCLDLERM